VPLSAALALIALGAFALRVFGLHHESFWLDEVDAISFASQPIAEQIARLGRTGENGPLYFIALKAWLTLSGTSEFGARFLSTAASTVAVPLLGQVSWKLFRSRATAITAAALAALSPYYVWFAQDAKMYPAYALLALAAQYCLLRAWGTGAARAAPTHGWRWWIAYVIANSLALYVHLFAALQIAANTAAGIWIALRSRRRERWFAFATLALIAPYIPLAAWQAPVLLGGANVGYSPASLRMVVVTLLEQLTWHLSVSPPSWWLALLLAALTFGIWRSNFSGGPVRLDGVTASGLLVIWLVVPVLGTMALQATVPVFRDRYLIPLAAPLLLALARSAAPPWGTPSIACAALLAASFTYGLAHRPPNPDFRAAAALVRELSTPDEPIGFLAEYAERPFAYYLNRLGGDYQKVTLPYTNYPGMSEQEGLLAVARSLRAGRTMWIVRFEDWLWDSRQLASQYLVNRGARPVVWREFDGVSVTRYELPS
jgi:4-amino-4-deoxy-L-arabinose transferase-like glycosyltransferase